jgi:hypothetical protein
VIDPVSSSITQQTKKRPLEDDTATTGAYLQLVLHICFFTPSFVYLFLLLYLYEKHKRANETDRTTICFDII